MLSYPSKRQKLVIAPFYFLVLLLIGVFNVCESFQGGRCGSIGGTSCDHFSRSKKNQVSLSPTQQQRSYQHSAISPSLHFQRNCWYDSSKERQRYYFHTSRTTVISSSSHSESNGYAAVNATAISDSNTDAIIKEKKKKLTEDFLAIGVPAFIQLAAEPLASLVDTAYLGRLGPATLGGAGVAISAHYAVSKLYNDPLLRTSISLVASASGATESVQSAASDSQAITQQSQNEKISKDLSVAVSSALLLATVVGVVQMIVYTVFCKSIMIGMGLSPIKDAGAGGMWIPAIGYLSVRAIGTPAATLWLVTNGIFRGLGDTQTPLRYAFVFTILNAILDPVFMFGLHWGAAGAAAGTAIAQYVALVPLIFALHRKVGIDLFGQIKELKEALKQYLSAGGFVLIRTVGKVLAYSVCARQAALLGSVAAAAYNLTFQLGFATTQICEAVAVAVQTLLARELSAKSNTKDGEIIKASVVRHLIVTSLWLGGGVATTLSFATYWRRDWILAGLTTNASIRSASAAIFPIVLLTQILKGLAYPVNGIIMGGLDWVYSMIAMWIANGVCVGMVYNFAKHNVNGVATLSQLWWSLSAFMAVQVVSGILRYQSKTGVWNVLRAQKTR
jgi:putative MATE family efflux protein